MARNINAHYIYRQINNRRLGHVLKKWKQSYFKHLMMAILVEIHSFMWCGETSRHHTEKCVAHIMGHFLSYLQALPHADAYSMDLMG
jgi:hypothetical protein